MHVQRENMIHLEHGHIVFSIGFTFPVLNGLSNSKGFGSSPKVELRNFCCNFKLCG